MDLTLDVLKAAAGGTAAACRRITDYEPGVGKFRSVGPAEAL